MLVRDDGVEPDGRALFAQESENFAPHLGQVVLGVEMEGGLFALGFERFDACEIRIGQHAGAQGGERGGELRGFVHLQHAHHEETGAAETLDDHVALGVEQCRVARFVHEVVEDVGRFLGRRFHRACSNGASKDRPNRI